MRSLKHLLTKQGSVKNSQRKKMAHQIQIKSSLVKNSQHNKMAHQQSITNKKGDLLNETKNFNETR